MKEPRDYTGRIEYLRLRIARERVPSKRAVLIGHFHEAMIDALDAGVPIDEVAWFAGKTVGYVKELIEPPEVRTS